ncbi:DUF459 domain-containing protein [Providencia rettgeri]|uniref:SGNH/GDSL hydrolase family protein n=1 Tax=Providencia rettgeri TaxID=587 RepID=UPI00235E675F|nr:DUF459 domain-containing protein [Providencia rettgeri]
MSYTNARPVSHAGRSTLMTRVTAGQSLVAALALILSTSCLLIWLNQHALMRYWQQRYHTEAPWASWQGNPVWDFWGRLYQAVDSARHTFIQQLTITKSEEQETDEKVKPSHIMTPKKPLFPNGFLQGSARQQGASVSMRPYESPFHGETPPPLTPLPLAPGDRVLFIGDSLMQGVAPHVKRTLLMEWGIHSLDLSRQSTGLRYPAFFNWPKTLDETLRQHPDITVVVVFLGPNDPWGLPKDELEPASTFKSERWEQRYRARIAQILHIAEQYQAHVIWVGPPNTRDTTLSQGMQYLRTLYQSEVNKAGEIYLDGNAVLQYSETHYADTFTDHTGSRKIRTADGVHFTPAGQRMLAKAIMTKLQAPQAPDTLQPPTHVDTTWAIDDKRGNHHESTN